MNKKTQGFTLVEIMIVVAIIAILAAIAIPNFISYRQTANTNTCKSNIKTLESATEAYLVTFGTHAAALTDLTSVPTGKTGTPVLKSIPTCPLGGTYNFTAGDDTSSAKISCPSYDASTHAAGTAAST